MEFVRIEICRIGICQNKSRPAGRNGVAHGGVAFFARESETMLNIYDFPNPEEVEVLIVEAKITNISRKCFVVAAYLPPR